MLELNGFLVFSRLLFGGAFVVLMIVEIDRKMMTQHKDEENQRYARQIVLPGVGVEGQEKLRSASVLVVGCGGLGSPVCLYLAAAGVGTLGLIDFDRVEASNLQRQILHGTAMLGQSKLKSAVVRLHDLNPDVKMSLYDGRMTVSTGLDWARNYDLIVDASDNYETRYASNEVAFRLGKPVVVGAVSQFVGQLSVFDPHAACGCYQCMVPDLPSPDSLPTPAQLGVMGAIVGAIGSLQACEVIKLILGVGVPLIGKMFHLDALTMNSKTVRLARNPHCPICGHQ